MILVLYHSILILSASISFYFCFWISTVDLKVYTGFLFIFLITAMISIWWLFNLHYVNFNCYIFLYVIAMQIECLCYNTSYLWCGMFNCNLIILIFNWNIATIFFGSAKERIWVMLGAPNIIVGAPNIFWKCQNCPCSFFSF